MCDSREDISSKFDKEGLKGAIEFTKILLALSGGAIAFILQPSGAGAKPTLLESGFALFSLAALGVCVISGLIVISGACVALSRREYDLENKYVMIPGKVNILSFAVGFILLAIYVAVKIFALMGPA